MHGVGYRCLHGFQRVCSWTRTQIMVFGSFVIHIGSAYLRTRILSAHSRLLQPIYITTQKLSPLHFALFRPVLGFLTILIRCSIDLGSFTRVKAPQRMGKPKGDGGRSKTRPSSSRFSASSSPASPTTVDFIVRSFRFRS